MGGNNSCSRPWLMVDMDWLGSVRTFCFVCFFGLAGQVFEKSALSQLRLTSMESAFN